MEQALDEFLRNRREREAALERASDWEVDSKVDIRFEPIPGSRLRTRLPSGHEIEMTTPDSTPTVRTEPVQSDTPKAARGIGHVLRHVTSWRHVVALGLILGTVATLAYLNR